MTMFQKAERRKAKLRLAIAGPSGSGKTFSALRIASGMTNRIALIDTECGSASLYADKFNFDVLEINPPYTPEKYIQGIKDAVKAGYELIIIDSLSHAWAGTGGLLDEHDKITAASKSGNSWTAWRKITPMLNQLVDVILQSPVHVIANMRSKQEYAQTGTGSDAKVKKLGMAPVMREGIEYEFTLVLDLDISNHTATSSKDRTAMFDNKYFTPTEETGKELLTWLNSGAEPVKTQTESQPQNTPDPSQTKATNGQRELLGGIKARFEEIWPKVCEELKDLFKVEAMKKSEIVAFWDQHKGNQGVMIEALKADPLPEPDPEPPTDEIPDPDHVPDPGEVIPFPTSAEATAKASPEITLGMVAKELMASGVIKKEIETAKYISNNCKGKEWTNMTAAERNNVYTWAQDRAIQARKSDQAKADYYKQMAASGGRSGD